MAPVPVTSSKAHPVAAGHGQSWQSQIFCLFTILGIVLLYTLCCHVYTVFVGWRYDAKALDIILAAPPPPGSGGMNKEGRS